MARRAQTEDGNGKKNRRGRGEGSIYKRKDGRWEGAVTLENGQRKRLYGKTRSEVATALNKTIRDQAEGKPIVPEKLTVAQFFTDWLAVAKTSVRLSTYTAYETYVRLHIVPLLGKTKVARLKPKDVQELYAKKLEEGLSTTSVVQMHRILHRALKQALRWGLVAANISEAVNPPRKRHVEYRTLDAEEARRFLEEAKGDRFEALYVLALSTGLREGELLALHWKEVDLDRGRLQVVATMQRDRINKGKFIFSEPKTDKSRRQVILTGTAIAALRRHHIAQLEHRLKAGPLWEDAGLVFPNSIGKPVEAGNLLRRSFWRILEKAQLPRIRFHDLRHSAATLLMGQGIHPKVVSEMLGHSKISVTLDLYSHVLPAMHQDAADAMDAILQSCK